MQIGSIGNGYQGALALAPTMPPERSGAGAAVGLAQNAGSGGSSESFHEILAHYDVTQITLRDFSELIQKLHESGSISDAEAKDLAQMRVELDQSNADEELDQSGARKRHIIILRREGKIPTPGK